MNNCLTHSLDRWCDQHGYVLLSRKSAHWSVAHVMHIDSIGHLTSYGPEKDLNHPLSALFGFDGVIKDYDPSPAPPMTPNGILVSAWLFAIGATIWRIKRLWKTGRNS